MICRRVFGPVHACIGQSYNYDTKQLDNLIGERQVCAGVVCEPNEVLGHNFNSVRDGRLLFGTRDALNI